MLTRKQMDLLAFIHKRMTKDGVPPSFDEMKEALDLRSKSGIHRLITALEERGFIRRLPHRARALEILKLPEAMENKGGGFVPRVIDGDKKDPPKEAISVASTNVVDLEIKGRIAAGLPIEAVQQDDNILSVPGSMLKGRDPHYALEVKGDSMIEAGINDGDIVIIREGSSAQNGDIVVAMVEGYETTLKTFRRNGNSIALEAANPAYATRVFRDDQVSVQGKLVGLIRNY